MWSRVAAIVGLALLVVPAASAAPGSVGITAHFPLSYAGEGGATGNGWLYSAGAAGTLHLQVTGAAGQAERVIHRAFGFANDDPSAQVLFQDRVQRIPIDLDGASLNLVSRTPDFQVLATDAQAKLEPATGSQLLVGSLQKSLEVVDELQAPLSIQFYTDGDTGAYQAELPAGAYQSRIMDGVASATGAQSLFLTGAEISYLPDAGAQETFTLHPHQDVVEGTVYNPITREWSGPGTHTEYVQEYILLHLTQGLVNLDVAGTPTFAYTDSLHLIGTGSLDAPSAVGTVTVQKDAQSGTSVTHTLHGDDLHLEGRFDLRMAKDASDLQTTTIQGSGDITQVRYAGVAANYPWGIAAAVGIGALILAGGAWLLSQGKILGGSAAASALAGYARVHGEEILQHPGRQEVYERVKAQPGVSFHALAEQVTFGASTLTYHLRVLEKNDYVTSLKDGRYVRFFDKHDASYARDRKNAASALRNPNTAAIAKHIKEHPGVAQNELAQKFAVTPSTVSWHVKRLNQVGLVHAQRQHPHTRYYAGEAWASLPASEQMAAVA